MGFHFNCNQFTHHLNTTYNITCTIHITDSMHSCYIIYNTILHIYRETYVWYTETRVHMWTRAPCLLLEPFPLDVEMSMCHKRVPVPIKILIENVHLQRFTLPTTTTIPTIRQHRRARLRSPFCRQFFLHFFVAVFDVDTTAADANVAALRKCSPKCCCTR